MKNLNELLILKTKISKIVRVTQRGIQGGAKEREAKFNVIE